MSTEKTNIARRATARPRSTAHKRPPRARRTRDGAAPGGGVAARAGADSGKVARSPKAEARPAKKGDAPRKGLPRTPDDLRDLAARFRTPLIVAAAVLVVLVVLYGPACSLYQAWRTNTALQERDAQATSETDELEGDINGLMTEEGIKDEARRRGYVDEGETRIVVEGEQTDDDQGAQQDDAQRPWYLVLGDFVFRYQGD